MWTAKLYWAARKAVEPLRDEEGASFAEYLILLVLIAGAMLIFVPGLRSQMVSQLQWITGQVGSMSHS